MTLAKKIIIGIAALLAVVVLANFGLNFWLTNQLPKNYKRKQRKPL